MAHGTKVNGSAYGITGGKCLVDGTEYAIKKGRTLIGGTGYDINFAKKYNIITTVDGYDADDTRKIITPNGDIIAGESGFVNEGDSITVYYHSTHPVSTYITIFLNGKQVAYDFGRGDTTATYKMVVSSDLDISFEGSNSNSKNVYIKTV